MSATTAIQVMKPEEIMPPTVPANALATIDEFRTRFEALKETIETLKKANPESSVTTQLAHTTRIACKDIRVELDKKRKELTEDLHDRKSKIDTAAREIRLLIEPIEKELQEIEDHEKNQLAKRIAELAKWRFAIAESAGAAPSWLVSFDLGRISNEEWELLLATIDAEKKKADARVAAAEAERQKSAAELDRMRAENKRLSDAATARGAATRAKEKEEAAARQLAEQAAAEERRRREAAEAELAAQAAAVEAQRLAAEQEERRKAALPDKGKLLDFTDSMLDLMGTLPAMVTPEGRAAAVQIKHEAKTFAARIAAIAGGL